MTDRNRPDGTGAAQFQSSCRGCARGFLSFDLALYFLELVLLAYYGMLSASYLAGRDARHAADSATLERLAAFSDYLVKYALAQEKNGALISHVVDGQKLREIREHMAYYDGIVGANLSIGFGGEWPDYQELGDSISTGTAICLQRLVILGDKISMMEVCADA